MKIERIIKPEDRLYYDIRPLQSRPYTQSASCHRGQTGTIVAYDPKKGGNKYNNLGYINFEADECGTVYIQDIVVNPNMRRRGLGTLLLSDLEKWACEKGMSHITGQASGDGKEFLTKRGYQPIGINHGFLVVEKPMVCGRFQPIEQKEEGKHE
jgi:GNAT superfamily N-acetyltransferase